MAVDTILKWLYIDKVIKRCVFEIIIVIASLDCAFSNPCFLDYASNSCLSHIAERRVITLNQAAELRERALFLYKNEMSPPSAVYDVPTVAVACLASAGLLRAGHDSDCAACGPACTQESRLEICELYCVYYSITSTPITTIWPKLGFNAKCCEEDKTTVMILNNYLKYDNDNIVEYLYISLLILIVIAIIGTPIILVIVILKIIKFIKRSKYLETTNSLSEGMIFVAINFKRN